MDKSNTTSVSLNEHLSALLDDEAGAFEQRRVLDELTADDSLRKKLSAYSLIGESMRSVGTSDSTLIATSDFLAGMHEKIDAEAEYHDVQIKSVTTSGGAANSSWLRPIGGFALAASVAAVAVIGFQNYQNGNQGGNLPSDPVIASLSSSSQAVTQKTQLSVADMSAAKVVSATDIVANEPVAKSNADTVYAYADAQTRTLLKRYVDSHMQFASNTTFVPSVRAIAYSNY